jgi:alpha-L-fucosidase 2
VKGLRARGGWTVDFTWKDGAVADCKVKAGVGGKLKMKINGKMSEYDVKPGASVSPEVLAAQNSLSCAVRKF